MRSRPRNPELFDPADYPARPSAGSRLLAMASLPARPPTDREQRQDEDATALTRLLDQGRRLADEFSLRYRVIAAAEESETDWYGICYEDGEIRIRLRHARTGRLLKESSLVDTLCHELAHLRHFDHSPRWRRFYRRILDRARELGYYRPAPDADSRTDAPRQGLLFEGMCATGRRPRRTEGAPRAERTR